MINVFIVDDHQAVLWGTKAVLESHNMQITCSHSAPEALEIIKERQFDIMIYDLKMPDMNGLELTAKTLAFRPEAKILILTGEDIAAHYDVLIEAGVHGMMDKTCSSDELVFNIKMALQQQIVLPLALARQLRTKEASLPSEKPLQKLTDKEVAVLQLAARGKKNKEVATDLFMSQRNVEHLLSQIFLKLNVNSRVEAIRKGLQLRIID